ncbi:MAG: hypothetical protein Q4C67_10160, partial [Deinococcus sp.]|nr:hypothetical protein [Deinococcus sp.]
MSPAPSNWLYGLGGRMQQAGRPGQRKSVMDMDSGLWGRVEAAYLGYPSESRLRVTALLRSLIQNDEEVSGTAQDYLAIV